MTQNGNPGGTAKAVIGLTLLSGSPIAFVVLLGITAGWWTLAFPGLALLTLLGWRMATVNGSGSAGAREREAGMPYMVQLDPEDPDAGVPRRNA